MSFKERAYNTKERKKNSVSNALCTYTIDHILYKKERKNIQTNRRGHVKREKKGLVRRDWLFIHICKCSAAAAAKCVEPGNIHFFFFALNKPPPHARVL